MSETETEINRQLSGPSLGENAYVPVPRLFSFLNSLGYVAVRATMCIDIGMGMGNSMDLCTGKDTNIAP